MKNLFLFSLLLLLSACSKEDDTAKVDADLQAVLDVVKGKILTQEPFVFWVKYGSNDVIEMYLQDSSTATWKVSEKRGVKVAEGDTNPGTRAYFAGEGYEMYITILSEPVNWDIHVATWDDGVQLQDQYYHMP